MKKLLWILLPVMLLAVTAVSVSASPFISDNAALLTYEQTENLEAYAAGFQEEYGISLVVLTEDGIGGEDPMMYAADFYDFGGYSSDGVILFLDMGERDWRIVCSGVMMSVIGDYELSYIDDNVIPYFSEGDFYSGFGQFLSITADLYGTFLTGGENGLPGYYPEDEYDRYGSTNDYYEDSYPDIYYEETSGPGMFYYAGAAVVAVIAAFLVCAGFKSQLNTAVPKNSASDYFDRNQVHMTRSSDKFLYSRVTKVRRETDSSRSGGSGSIGGMRSFSGSSGRSHTGGGGKF